MTSGIIEILIENAGIQALVGKTVDDAKYKVFPVIAEEKDASGEPITVPYITVYKNGNDPLTSLTKDYASQLDYPRVTVVCWSKNFRPTELMFEAIRLALDNASMTTDNGYNFNRIWLVDDRDGFDSEKTGLFYHVATFACEVKRSDGTVWQNLVDNNFNVWGGIWNWSAHGNAYPVSPNSGTVWLTEGDRLTPGQDEYIPNDSFLVSSVDNASSFNDYTVNLA